jgi:aminoglycoside 6'-N-acetyltransferase
MPLTPAYRVRRFRGADLPMVAQWLRTAAVRRWWGPPAREHALLAVDLREPRMRQWIVAYRGRAFAYAQAYNARAWPQAHLRDLPAGTLVIDAFMGVAAMRRRGHGAGFLRGLARRLIASGAPLVAIDPVAANWRARRAFPRVGFVTTALRAADQGTVALMLYRRHRAARKARADS